MTNEVENRPRDCTACRTVGSVGLVGIGAYLANAAFKNKTLPGKIVVATISLSKSKFIYLQICILYN